MSVECLKSWKCFDGIQYVYRHASTSTGTNMDFAVFVPGHADGDKLSSLTFLSGLTCNWENFTTKAGAQRYAADHKMILIMPDTSPRGEGVSNDSAYDLGQGAGFYVDATQLPWQKNFKMWSYINQELAGVVAQVAPIDLARRGISGHSMGGHGALISAIRNPGIYSSVSAISPIVVPSQVPWGQKAFTAYLGADVTAWKNYDSCEVLKEKGWNKSILIDQGMNDEFLSEQLRPELFATACKEKSVDLHLRMQEGYDHSYYFIATVIGDHISYHAKELSK